MSIRLATKIQGPLAIIGDVHGQVDKLQAILEQLRRLPDYEQRWIVFLGDFVDRGPDPRGAVDLFIDLLKSHPRTTAIAGNHEFAMGGALGWLPLGAEGQWAQKWVDHYDSESTFSSYGVHHGDIAGLQRAIPERHKQLLSELPWVVEHPRCLCVHAGLDPNTPFALQLRILQQKDFTLNRPQWLFSKSYVEQDPPQDCPVPVASGHVRIPTAVIRPRRILLDTTGGTEGELSYALLPENRILTSAGNRVPVGHREPAVTTSSSWWKKIW